MISFNLMSGFLRFAKYETQIRQYAADIGRLELSRPVRKLESKRYGRHNRES